MKNRDINKYYTIQYPMEGHENTTIRKKVNSLWEVMKVSRGGEK